MKNLWKAFCLGLLFLGGSLHAQDIPDEAIEYRILRFGDGLTVFEDGPTPRLRVRANFYQGQGDNPWQRSPGQVSIEFGLPKWKPAYEQTFAQLPIGSRWRLGSNYWTNFSSSFPISLADQTLPPGYYYLVVEKVTDTGWKLIFLDPSQVRKLEIDPWHVNRQSSGSGVFSVGLTEAEKVDATEHLEIKMKLQDQKPTIFLIDIRFGPIHLQSSLLSVELP